MNEGKIVFEEARVVCGNVCGCDSVFRGPFCSLAEVEKMLKDRNWKKDGKGVWTCGMCNVKKIKLP